MSSATSWNTTGFIVEFELPFSAPPCYDPDGDGLCGTPAGGCPSVGLDADDDGFCDNDIDNCPETHNSDQLDLDRDGIGIACDTCLDMDNDTVCAPDDCNDNSSIIGTCVAGSVCDLTQGKCSPCEGAQCGEGP